ARHVRSACRVGGAGAIGRSCQLARLLRPGRQRCAGGFQQYLRPCGWAKPVNNTLIGFTEVPIAQFGLTFWVAAFILYMLFIVLNLALESKAGKFGTFILFLVLSFGMLGFLAKNIIQWVLGI